MANNVSYLLNISFMKIIYGKLNHIVASYGKIFYTCFDMFHCIASHLKQCPCESTTVHEN